jgi:hypothetical protein
MLESNKDLTMDLTAIEKKDVITDQDIQEAQFALDLAKSKKEHTDNLNYLNTLLNKQDNEEEIKALVQYHKRKLGGSGESLDSYRTAYTEACTELGIKRGRGKLPKELQAKLNALLVKKGVTRLQ